jgi:predicted transposase YdaD
MKHERRSASGFDQPLCLRLVKPLLIVREMTSTQGEDLKGEKSTRDVRTNGREEGREGRLEGRREGGREGGTLSLLSQSHMHRKDEAQTTLNGP